MGYKYKKGNCKRSCVPLGFEIIKNDKRMNIDKTKDSINLETDAHNISTKFGNEATMSDSGGNETQEAIKQMMKI